MFFVNNRSHTLYYIDSLNANCMVKRSLLANWTKFTSTRAGYKGIKWKIDESKFCAQRDSYNCGVFVCYFFRKIITNELNLDTETDINEFRNTIRDTIINNSIKI